MKQFLRMVAISTLLVFTLVGCGTGSSQKDAMSDEAMAESSEMNFELNGDSDGNKAGGLQSVYFDFNSSQLTASTKEALDSNAKLLTENPNVEVQVEGHCDERGSVQYNLALGERRANAIKDYLVALGVDEKKISTISFGKERPLAFGHDEDSWSQNRRGNFVVTAK